MNKSILNLLERFESEFDLIEPIRKSDLLLLSEYIKEKFYTKQHINITVICTHNSRRSHLGQIWLEVAADYYGINDFSAFSGGTEATAFNFRMVNALIELGFKITTRDAALANPKYSVNWGDNHKELLNFSKTYDHAINPQSEFAAIMVCSDADEACPNVNGSDFRLSLPYDDPKAYDDTSDESAMYLSTALLIGREMTFVMSQV